ncbi:redoxin family protein [Pedobacter sp. LMG 31464]|uniref:Redoxin family protein n=1 Tax=Pedobacter planticolens TaxID=2679964 RepID=A0A923IX51_9SPHI|nr:TlpA disulfide reductase family protein [Pedobacter planticolens]MBB2146804.1 redoxin family protein [Pedobacter planticolens]
MRKIIILILLLGNITVGFAQNKFFTNYSELHIGNRMPNIKLDFKDSKSVNVVSFADLKGKLVIFDFWSTYCPDCVASFPYMEELQNKFKDKIQVILVNSVNSDEDINKLFENTLPSFKGKFIPRPKLPSIQGITGKNLLKLFPHLVEPFHAWVDPTGIVRLLGSQINSHNMDKISEVIEGRAVTFIDYNKNYNGKEPFFLGINKKLEILKSGSIITSYSPDLADPLGKIFENRIDSLAGTIRNSLINFRLVDLYQYAFSDHLKYFNKINLNANRTNQIVLFVKDTLNYSIAFKDFNKLTDLDLQKSSYSYESILPQKTPNSVRKEYMLQDLNRYFSYKLGAFGELKKIDVKCLVLIRTSNVDKLKAINTTRDVRDTLIENKAFRIYKGCEMREVIRTTIFDDENNPLLKDRILLDETFYQGKIDMIMPIILSKQHITLDDLRKSLIKYDLDIVEKTRLVERIVISEKIIP